MPTTSSQTFTRRARHAAAVAVSLAATLTLTGCGVGANGSAAATSTTAAAPAVRLHGHVHGGEQPVSGSTIQLYDIPTINNGYGYTLLSPAPTTGPDGSFNITGQYQCLGPGDLTYLVATGGNPGLAAGTNNAAISLVAVLGLCNTANPDTNGDGGFYYTLDPNLDVTINEVTTVAAAYALAPFTSGDYYGEIGSASSSTALATAFTNATMLADIGVGLSPGPGLPSAVTYDPSTGFPNVINTVADIIASCVSSTGTGGACSTLFSSFGIVGAYPSDTFGAAVAMATHPGINVLNLYDLKAPQPPFTPFLPKPPNDWTVALKYTGLGLSGPQGLAFDSLSNLWIANATSNYITEIYSGEDGINTTGASSQYNGGGDLLGPQALAVDLSNNLWIANTASSSVVEMDDYGNVLGYYHGGGINAPVSIALDTNGNAWVANFNGNSITQLLSNGTPSSFSPITQGLSASTYVPVSLPTFVAVDSSNNVWVSNAGLNTTYGLTTGMLSFDQNGNPLSCTTQNLAEPLGIAFDPSGTAWVAANGISAVQPFTSACATNGSPITGGGLSSPVALAVDGAGNIWAANATGDISEQTATTGTPASPAIGYGALNQPDGIAIDACGSVWTANAGDNSVTEFIGLAAPPAATPIVAAFKKASGQHLVKR